MEGKKVHSPFMDITWGANPADMQLISKMDKVFKILLCVMLFLANKHELFL